MAPKERPGPSISSQADAVSAYVNSIEYDVTGDLIAEGLQTMLARHTLMVDRPFWVHVTWREDLDGYDIEVRMTNLPSAYVLLPSVEMMTHSTDVDSWNDYMKLFVISEVLPVIRKRAGQGGNLVKNAAQEWKLSLESTQKQMEQLSEAVKGASTAVYEMGSYRPIRIEEV